MGLLIETVTIAKSLQAAFLQCTVFEQLILLFSLPVLWTLVSYVSQKTRFRSLNAPIVGEAPGLVLPIWRARLRYIFNGVEMIKEGYEKVIEAMSRYELLDVSNFVFTSVYKYHFSGPDGESRPTCPTNQIYRGAEELTGNYDELFSGCGRREALRCSSWPCAVLIFQPLPVLSWFLYDHGYPPIRPYRLGRNKRPIDSEPR